MVIGRCAPATNLGWDIEIDERFDERTDDQIATANKDLLMSLFYLVPLQLFLIACAEVLAAWVRMPLTTLIGIGICGLAAVLGAMGEAIGRPADGRYAKFVLMAGAIVIPGTLLLPRIQIPTLDNYHAIIAWLIAGTLFVPVVCESMAAKIPGSPATLHPSFGGGWRKLALVWAFIGVLTWLAASYYQNEFLAFHFGLAISVVLLILARLWFRLNVASVLMIHTLVLFLIGLPAVDVLIRPRYRLDARPRTRRRYYSYNAAKKNPVAFANWWQYYNQQWEQLLEKLAVRDVSERFPWLLRPGSSGDFFQSHIVINSEGFRGKEFSPHKGRAFRIVAVGESTTFGVTMNPDDQPWPELLEEMIRVRLHPQRPVEVINAGIPAHTLQHTLSRLENEILPLKPDMILCYHGINGFHLLLDLLPRADGPRPPKYQARPLKLLADAEYGLKIRLYKRGMLSCARKSAPHAIDPMNSAYADAYRLLIQAARTNHIRLAIANFSLAVNSDSDNDVVEFYRGGFPAVHWQIQANALHARMVHQLADENPDVCFVDTHPRLDGFHEKFIDLMHLTQEGRQEVAEAFYAGIEKTLQDCLAKAPENSTANN